MGKQAVFFISLLSLELMADSLNCTAVDKYLVLKYVFVFLLGIRCSGFPRVELAEQATFKTSDSKSICCHLIYLPGKRKNTEAKGGMNYFPFLNSFFSVQEK